MCSSHAQRYSARKQKDGRRTGRAKVFLWHSRTTTKFPQGVSKQGDKGKRRDETRVTSAEREI